jgi:TetR/AcrR family transcriptional regulator, cholesterol catabolism regulator
MDKSKILREARRQFFRSGVKAVTVDEICYALGISKKTFYSSYRHKEEMVTEFINELVEERLQGLESISKLPDAIEQLRQFDKQNVDLLYSLPPAFLIDVKRFSDKAYAICLECRASLVEKLVSIIEFGKRQGVFRREIDPRILSELRFTQLELLVGRKNEFKFGKVEEIHQEVFTHYLAGLSAKTLS